MLVAFATQDLARINAHFGWARHIAIYDVLPEGYQFVRVESFDGPLAEDGNERKLEAKLQAVHDCALVFATAIGDPALASLTVNETHSVIRYAGQPIVTALDDLQAALRQGSKGWVRKHLQKERQQ